MQKPLCKTLEIQIDLSCTCKQAKTVNKANITPAEHQHVHIVTEGILVCRIQNIATEA